MTHLALVTAFPPSQGSLNEYGFHLAMALAKRPDVTRLTIIGDFCVAPTNELHLPDKIEVRRVWSFGQKTTALKIASAVRKARPDGVIFNLQTASFGGSEIPAALGLFSPMITRLLGFRTGVICHNLIDAIELDKTVIGDSFLRKQLVKIAAKVVTRVLLCANYVTVTLDGFADILEKKYRSKNTYLVPHGTFPAPKFDTQRMKQRDLIVSTMGKFGTYKKLDRLISAFKLVASKHPKLSLKLKIGGTDHPAAEGYIEKLSKKYTHDPAISFEGYVEEEKVADFFASSRLAVFDYDATTGSSGVLHQAAGFGTPAAYPLIGDFIDVTEREGLIGFHYQPFDVESLAEAIEEALLNAEKAEQIVQSNLIVSNALPMDTVAAFHAEMLSPQRKRPLKLRDHNKLNFA
ncbi:MAG: glycosyltransferase [Hyphomonas sp.]